MMIEIKKIPKIELHNHLDGSVPLLTLKELAQKSGQNYSLAQISELSQATHSKNLNEYLQKFEFPLRFLQTKENLMIASQAIIAQAAQNGVIYLELRFAPTLHTQQGLNLDEVIAAISKGVIKAQQKYQIIVRLITIAMRDQSEIQAIATFAAGIKNDLVVGGDLAGEEANYPPEKFAAAFSWAKAHNFPLTIHAGEDGGVKNIITAINYGAKRIGHGVAGKDQRSVIELAQKQHVAFEICLKSNLDTQAIPNLAASPLRFYYDNQVAISINTDDQTVSATDENQEYQRALATFNLNLNDFYQIDQMAVNAAFCDPATKIKLKQILKQKFQELSFNTKKLD